MGWSRRRFARSVALLVVATVVATACSGGDGGPAAAKVVDVEMREMSFEPDRFRFQVGDQVTFRFHNLGEARHEAVIGDQAVQDAAVAAMASMDIGTTTDDGTGGDGGRGRGRLAWAHPGMDFPNMVSVEPGDVAEITFKFTKATTVLMQCHEAGHLEAGMTATVEVVE